MVKFPKIVKTYCKICKFHTSQKLFEYKSGKPSLFAQGKRRYDRKQKGYVGQTKPVFRKKIKTTKKLSIRKSCIGCNKSHMKKIKRTKRFELIASKI
mmetsp:Transcript_9339/g.23003  ORF Transcript_9339/g.23003 Transcript_9339/m.23003 type:complete len:97 (-) Transcript_9339:1012-1302(-)